jgi:mono/diheme cytochrome c family protein
MMRTIVTVVIGLSVLGSVVAAQTPDPAKVAAGAKVYETAKCATCHAINGKGGKVSTALDGVGAKLSPEDLGRWFTHTAEMEAKLPKKPTVTMSAYLKTHKLTDADVEAVIAYMSSLK